MQRMRRDEDLSAERAWLHREHATKTYEDLSITKGVKPKRSVEEVERDAVYAVDRHNAAEMERIDTRRDTRIAEVVLQAKAQEQSTDRTASVLEAKTNLRNSFDHARGRDRER